MGIIEDKSQEVFTITPYIKWFQEGDWMPFQGRFNKPPVLKQMWQGSLGNQKWEEIKTEIKKDG